MTQVFSDSGIRREIIIKFETALDHLTGEEAGLALTALNDMPEVLDAIYLTGIGKKNRPCCLLQVLCHNADEDIVAKAIFRHTHSLGLRRMEVERIVLPRFACDAEIAGRTIPAKAYGLENRVYLRPEADAVQNLAAELGTGAPALRIVQKNDEPGMQYGNPAFGGE